MRGDRCPVTTASDPQPEAFASGDPSMPAMESGTIYAQLLATFQPVTPTDIPPSIPAAAPSAQPPVLSSNPAGWTRCVLHLVRQTVCTPLGLILISERPTH